MEIENERKRGGEREKGWWRERYRERLHPHAVEYDLFAKYRYVQAHSVERVNFHIQGLQIDCSGIWTACLTDLYKCIYECSALEA